MLCRRSTIAAGAITLVLCSPACAASDITVAAIATGRLYVLGRTEHPHTPVVLDGQFRTESDDRGHFQYELIYHPASCIVSATIDGKTYAAVVGDCGERCLSNPPPTAKPEGAALSSTANLASTTAASSPSMPASAEQPKAAKSSEAVAPVPSATVPDTTSAVNGAHLPHTGLSNANPITNPPLPPSRPAFQLETRARTLRPYRTPQGAKRNPRQDPDDQEVQPED